MTLNGVLAVILRYFSEFTYLPGVLRKSSRSLSHLLMRSFLKFQMPNQLFLHNIYTLHSQPSELQTRSFSSPAKFYCRLKCNVAQNFCITSLTRRETSVLVSRGTSCLDLFHPLRSLAPTAASACLSMLTMSPT